MILARIDKLLNVAGVSIPEIPRVPNIPETIVSSFSQDPGIRTISAIRRMGKSLIPGKSKSKSSSNSIQKSNPTFTVYARAVLEKLDTIIDLLSGLNTPAEKIEKLSEEKRKSPERVRKKEDPRSGFLSFLAGIITGVGWKYLIRPFIQFIDDLAKAFGRLISRIRNWIKSVIRVFERMVKQARKIITEAGRIISRISNSIRATFRTAFQRMHRLLERIILNPIQGLIRTAGRTISGAFRSIRSGIESVGNRISGMFGNSGARVATRVVSINRLGSLGPFVRTLDTLGRRIPLLATIITPVIEGIESSNEIKNYADQRDRGEISESEFKRKTAESISGAVMDWIGISLGTGAGAFLGSILGPLGTFFGAVAGGWAGAQLSEWLKPFVAPAVANAILSTPEEAVKMAENLANNLEQFTQMLTPENLIERVRTVNPSIADTLEDFQRQQTSSPSIHSAQTRINSSQSSPIVIPAPAQASPSNIPSTTVVVDARNINVSNQRNINVPFRGRTHSPFNPAGVY